MSVILARLHERQAPGAQMVHIFAAEQDSPDGMRKAYCGFTAHYSWLKSVSGLAGMPCELCLLDAPLKVAETSAEVIELPTEIDMAGPLFAIGLRGERVWHEVPSDPIVGDYESRSVVLTVCGCMGWLMPGDPYLDWSRCRECDETR
ncbi:hypothetical protein SAMN04487904_102419 [Actinopolyspora lacussalsi subsp. righensis]|uniref:Uncharacterized protein n=1 Tax=Actinopolyspora righensis TaxID=995060 RepID=A0A1I6YDH4_9ACTN|nr:hypothetical protein [Actinopolyspora righensis]SFT48244.1 hypothetical protein SAMN04487904_102419 [Actinopolyspora righensis]